MKMKMKRNRILKTVFVLAAVVVAIMVLVKFIPGAEKVVPEPLYNFADKFAVGGVAVLLIIVGALIFNVIPVAGIALILIGASMIYFTYLSRKSE